MKKIHITTLGCAKNLVDTEVLSAQLKYRNYQLTAEPRVAELILINTCGFITEAKKESLQAIFEAIEVKRQNPEIKVVVCGCLSQRYKKELAGNIKEVDAFFGTEDYGQILNYLGEDNFHPEEMYVIRAQNSTGHYAYLKISEGCNHNCAFCAIPAIRGRQRSRRREEIIKEAQVLAARGVKELILISQDTSSYGQDLYGEQRIVELVTELAAMEVFTWIRTLYWYPTNFPLTFIELMNKYPSIIPYLDMPIQHISNRVLGYMHRAERKAQLSAFYKRVREIRPDITLRTTLLLGHPGEQQEDFDKLKDFIQKICFDRLGTFVYSDEEGTASYAAQDKVSSRVALRRRDQIMKIQQKIARQKNEQLLDTVQKVMIDTWHADGMYYSGRTYRDAPEIDNEVLIPTSGNLPDLSGTFQSIRIDDASEYELYGSVTAK
jgi:ribosomal protein S12 methylthiotransferase